MIIKPHSESYTIRICEVDHSQRVTIPALLNLMQEAALQQLIDLKLDHTYMIKEFNAMWVLMKQEIQIKDLPKQGDQIQVTTFPVGFEKVFAYRDFYVRDQFGNLMASASSTWVLMNMETRRLARMPKFFSELTLPTEGFLPKVDFKLSPVERVDVSRAFRVDLYDLDFNGHLNNVMYARWILEAIPEVEHKPFYPATFQIQYKQEARKGDQIMTQIQQDGSAFNVRLVRTADEAEIALGRVWTLESSTATHKAQRPKRLHKVDSQVN